MRRGTLGWLARWAEKVVELLGQAFELMAEDDPIQPAIKYLYVTLYEADIRLAVLEDWYLCTYVLEGRMVVGGHDDHVRATERKEGEQADPKPARTAGVDEIEKSVRNP